jgi:radical SAM protein with 4Fe4S-binding SPASM domain
MNYCQRLALLNRFTWQPRYLLNRWRQAREYLQGATRCRALPNFITLELTNLCNLNCVLCPHSKLTRPQGVMELELFKTIIDQVKDYVEVVDLDLYGEFAYNPAWAEMIGYAKRRGLFTVLNTNATLLDEELSRKLCGSGLDLLSISFDGASPETYAGIRQGADYHQTRSNILNFLRRNRSIYTVMQMVRTTRNQHEIAAFRRMWRSEPLAVIRIKDYLPYDPERSGLDPLLQERARAPAAACLYLWKSLTVCQDGTIIPCCSDYNASYALGNARSTPIAAAWNSPALQDLRARHAAGAFRAVELCRRCSPLTFPPLVIMLSSLADDSIRRKILPCFK